MARNRVRELPTPRWLTRLRRAQLARTIEALEPGVERWLRGRILRTTIDMEHAMPQLFNGR